MSSVLVVDDSEDVRETLSESLHVLGYEVALASNGLEALEVLAQDPKPGLILLDLLMPVMDGWEFRSRQKKDPSLSDIPTVVITADNNSKLNAQLMGAVQGLRKPVDWDELVEVVRKHCK